jgi:hypothetical protein
MFLCELDRQELLVFFPTLSPIMPIAILVYPVELSVSLEKLSGLSFLIHIVFHIVSFRLIIQVFVIGNVVKNEMGAIR